MSEESDQFWNMSETEMKEHIEKNRPAPLKQEPAGSFYSLKYYAFCADISDSFLFFLKSPAFFPFDQDRFP